jgi:hypothetical protein
MGIHYIVVEPWEPDVDPDELIQVEHPADCPTIVRYAGDGEHPDVVELNCDVGFYVGEHGLSEYFVHADDEDANDYAERVGPGRHEIEAWHVTHPGGPWGATEYDAGLRLAEPDGVS